MKTFLAIFTCAENSENHEKWKLLTKKEQQERMTKGMASKAQWEEKYKSKIVYDGGMLGEETKLVDNKGIHNLPSKVGHFFVVQAPSHDEAAKMFLEHPHFAIFPGDGVEITERTTVPRV